MKLEKFFLVIALLGLLMVGAVFLITPACAATIDVGSGYTYSTVQAGIAAASSGDSVHVHAGTYTITTCIQAKSGVTLYGDGYNNTIIKSASYNSFPTDNHASLTANMMMISGITDFEMYGFTMHGGATSEDQQHSNGGLGDGRNSIGIRGGSSNIRIHDIYFTRGCGDCVFGGVSSYVYIYNCYMEKPGHDGVQLWGATHWVMDNIQINRMVNSGVRYASDTNNNRVSNCTFYTDYGGGYACVELEGMGSGNSVDHSVFKVSSTIAVYSGGGTLSLTDNIFYNLPVPTSPIGSVTLSPNTGNLRENAASNWASRGYGFNPAKMGNGGVGGGGSGGSALPVYDGAILPSLISPSSSSSISSINGNVTLSWQDVNSTAYQIQVSNSSDFASVEYNVSASSPAVSLSMASGTHYWKVAAHNDVGNNWTAYTAQPYSFNVAGDISGTSGIFGVIYDTTTANPIEGAVVTILNNTWSETTVTGIMGYYDFSVPINSGTYWVTASATNYQAVQASPGLPITVTTDYNSLNIALTKSPSYFPPHHVTFNVITQWGSRIPGATVEVYTSENNPDNQSPDFNGTTGTMDGSVSFELQEDYYYTVVVTLGNDTKTETVYPKYDSYWIVLETTEVEDGAQLYETVSITNSKTLINATYATITSNYTDTGSETQNVSFALGTIADNGTFIPLTTGTKDAWTKVEFVNNTATSTWGVNDYLGESYVIQIQAVHDRHGAIEERYSVRFDGSNLPFADSVVTPLACIFIILTLVASFGRFERKAGPIIICGIVWVMQGLSCFDPLNPWIPGVHTIMSATLTIATVLSLMIALRKED